MCPTLREIWDWQRCHIKYRLWPCCSFVLLVIMTLRLVTRIPRLHYIYFTMKPGSQCWETSSAMLLCCSCKGRGTGEDKQQEWAFCQLSVAAWAAWATSCQLRESRSCEGPWTKATPAHSRWWRLLPSHSIKSTSEVSAYCCPHSKTSRRKPVPKYWHFGARFVLAYLHLQCNSC